MTLAHIPSFMNTNTHILVHDFEYYDATTIEEALQLLESRGKNALPMLGGTNVIISMKMERMQPDAVISLMKIPGIADITKDPDGSLSIGAGATIHTIRYHPYIRAYYPALAEACAAFGSTQIQIMGTIGGNICNGSPASDTVPSLIAHDARLVLRSKHGTRQLNLEEFLKGPGMVDLRQGEILTTIILPPPRGISLFIKVSRVAADLSKASLAVWMDRDGDMIRDCRIAFGSVAPVVLRLPQVDAMLAGKKFEPVSLTRVSQAAAEGISPIDDVRSTAWYRRKLVKAMTTDALNEVWKRSQDKAVEVAFKAVKGPNISSAGRKIPAGGSCRITLTVNGGKHDLDVRPGDLLLNILRDRLDLRGAKYGCGLGECGACTVLMDGRAALSCLVLAVAAEGHAITTVEGLRSADGRLDLVQDMFLEESALQCGYCTPGFLMATKSLLNENPHPDEDQIRDYIKGNRCRCTGYASIVRAAMRCAGRDAT